MHVTQSEIRPQALRLGHESGNNYLRGLTVTPKAVAAGSAVITHPEFGEYTPVSPRAAHKQPPQHSPTTYGLGSDCGLALRCRWADEWSFPEVTFDAHMPDATKVHAVPLDCKGT